MNVYLSKPLNSSKFDGLENPENNVNKMIRTQP